MPFEVMDQRGGSGSSNLYDDLRLPSERQTGFWNSTPDHQGTDGVVPTNSSKLVASSLIETLPQGGAFASDHAELPQSILLAKDRKEKIPIGEGTVSKLKASWNAVDHPKSWSSLSGQPASYTLGRGTAGRDGTQWESSLFSSSFSDIFSRNLRLSTNDVQSPQHAKPVASTLEDEELFESIEEIEAQTIGNLLPAEDDLLSGVTNELGHNVHGNGGDDLEDFDLFSSGGGMELENTDRLNRGQRNSDFVGGFSLVGAHPYGENPSRTLFVRNINSNVEDSELKALFEQYGDIRTLYTACKHRGFVMISYFDIRASRNAMRSLQSKPLRHRKLDIHYSIPKQENPSERDINQGVLLVSNLDSSVSSDELRQIFGAYGDIREFYEVPQKQNQKLIAFYDSRAAEAALSALQGTVIAGSQIKLEASFSSGTRSLIQQPEQEADKPNLGQSTFDDLSSGRIAFSPGVIGSSILSNGSTHTLHSAIQSPMGAFIDPHRSSSVPNHLPSPMTMASLAKHFGVHEPSRLMDEMKFANQRITNFHPHSLPDQHDGLVNGIPYNSPSTIGGLASGVSPNMMEGINNRHIRGIGSNGHLMELNGGIFGSPGNGNYSVTAHLHAWNNSNSGQQHPPGHMIWPNSPSLVNGAPAHNIPHVPGFPRAPPVMMNTTPAHLHVGSAPSVNRSLWERQHAYSGESPEASSFHLGSLGSGGFPGSSPPHPMDIAARNIYSHGGGHRVDMTKNTGMPSPQQMGHMFPGRNQMMSMAGSFDSPSDRVRSFSHRRMEVNANSSDKKQYELDIDRILRGEDNRTTLMIKNIPNKYTSKMLLAAIDEHCRGTYDFIYLPIDFKNKCNVGYAFINMTDAQQIIPFHKAFNGKKWEKFNSEKVASLAYARIQGKAALIAHFQNSSLMNEDKRCRPILFHTDGPNAGDPEPFPMGTNTRSRLGKPRTSGNEEIYRNGSPSATANGEEFSNGTDSSGSD